MAEGDRTKNCLIDLHGTCFVLPFHQEGLPYLYLGIIATILMIYLFRRIMAREINRPHHPSSWPEIILLLGRSGIILFLVGAVLDNSRLFLGSFDKSWPPYILSASPNATLATERWAQHHFNYKDVEVQLFMKWYTCIFIQFIPCLCVYSVAHLYYKASLRSSVHHNREFPLSRILSSPYKLFLTCSIIASATMALCLVCFIVGPIRGGPLKVIRVTELWSLSYTNESPLVGILVWQCSLIVFGAVWVWKLQGRKTICFFAGNVLCCIVTVVLYGDPRMAWLSQLVFIALQIWADTIHNPDDYGRLNDDVSMALRRPLLPSLSPQQQQDVQDSDDREGDDDIGEGGVPEEISGNEDLSD